MHFSPLKAQAHRKRPERTLEADAVTADSELPAEPTAGAARAASVEPDVLTSIAALLWLPSYTELFEAELEHNRTLCGWSGTALPPSSYRARLLGKQADVYDAKRRRQERDQLAIELHANNMRQWSPSLVARSLAYTAD